MPRVVKTGGVSFTKDVVKIRDLAPEFVPKKTPKTPEEEQAEIEAGFQPDFGGDDAPQAADASLEETPAGGEPAPEDAFEMDAVEAADPGAGPEPADDTGGAAAIDYEAGAADLDAAAAEPSPPPPPAPPVPDVSGEIIQSAMAEAGRILEDAVRSAEEKKAEVLSGVESELEQLRAQAVEAGKAQAMATVEQDLERMSAQLQDGIARFEGERAGFEVEYEDQLKWMSLEIAGKVLAKKVSEDDTVLTEMVDKAVQSLRSEPWIRVDVAQEMTGLIDSLTRLYEDRENVEVSAVPAAPGTVHLETASGVVDASLRTQLDNLRDYFSRSLPAQAAGAGA